MLFLPFAWLHSLWTRTSLLHVVLLMNGSGRLHHWCRKRCCVTTGAIIAWYFESEHISLRFCRLVVYCHSIPDIIALLHRRTGKHSFYCTLPLAYQRYKCCTCWRGNEATYLASVFLIGDPVAPCTPGKMNHAEGCSSWRSARLNLLLCRTAARKKVICRSAQKMLINGSFPKALHF